MVVKPQLQKFYRWLKERNRSDGTIRGYLSDVGRALSYPNLLQELYEDDLSPSTRQRKKAAIRAWARFRKDGELLELLSDLRLPAPRRQRAATPLPKDTWKRLRTAIATDPHLGDPERAILGMIAARGFRVGDVLRLRRLECVSGLQDGVLAFVAKGGRTLEYGVKPFEKELQLLVSGKIFGRVVNLVVKGDFEEDQIYRSAETLLTRTLRAVADRADLDIDRLHLHRLRRTYAVYWLEAAKRRGKGLEDLKQHMGWANLATAERYVDHDRRKELEEIGEDL